VVFVVLFDGFGDDAGIWGLTRLKLSPFEANERRSA